MGEIIASSSRSAPRAGRAGLPAIGRRGISGVWGLISSSARFVNTGFVLLARQRRLPALAWSSFGLMVVPLFFGATLVCVSACAAFLHETILFRTLLVFLIAFGVSLIMARRVLQRDALIAGVLEFGGGLLGLLFGPTPTSLLFIPAWVYKRRVLQAAQREESLSPQAVGAHLGAV